jgi:hypothetical protein
MNQQTAATRYISSTIGVSIPAHPSINTVAAQGINVATIPRVRNRTTPPLQIDSLSLIATHAHPVVAIVAEGLSREPAAVLKLAGVVDAGWMGVSG